jgi:plasmid stabilization system protein ParE
MENGYKVFWTNNALKDLRITLKYLKENWSEKEIVNFVRKLDKRLNLISINPKLYARTRIKKNVRKSVLTKHNVIYYTFESNLVKIIALFDSRQHPAKLKL